MRLFIGIAAVLAWIFGFALLAVPAAFYAPIGVAFIAGNLVVQVLSLVVVLRTMALGAGMKVAPGVVIHVALGALFAFFLMRTMRTRAAA